MELHQSPEGENARYPFLQGGGESGAIMRALDWNSSPVGTPDSWPGSLRTTIGILLHSAVPMFLFWGPELLCFYNDAYRPSLGRDGKHPGIGKPAAELWPETMHIIGPQLERVLNTGETRLFENELIPIYRNGRVEDVYWTYSYCPLYDDTGHTCGVFATAMETTAAVTTASGLAQSERRFRAMVTATADVVYRMSADWSIMQTLDGKGFLISTDKPTGNWDWLTQNVHPEDRAGVREAIDESIRNKSMFQLEHRVLQVSGETGWTFSRAVPILDEAGNITEWFGTATNITERRRIEDDLQEARERLERSKRLYETITDNTPDLIYVFDLNYRFTYANKALLTMWGRTWDESIGQGLRALGYEEWHATMHEREIDQIVATRQPVRGTVTFPHAVLGRRYYDYILTPVIGQGGEVEAVAGTTRDVTDFKNVEAAMRESEQRFRLMADAIPEIVWVADARGQAEYFNKRWEEYCGVTFEAAHYKKIAAEFIHPDDAPKVAAAFGKAIETGEPMEVEQRNRSASGEYRWFLNRAIPYRDPQSGEIVRWFGIGTDINDRKLTEQALQESENRFRAMAEDAPVWIWLTGVDVDVRYANKRMLAYFGLTDLKDFTGYAWEQLTHPDDVARVHEVFRKAAVEHLPFSFESRVRNSASGAYEWCFFQGTPHIEKGAFTGFIGTGLYIHDRKLLLENLEGLVAARTGELEQLNRALQRSNEDLQQFAHVASHDLKEPVRKILTFAGMLDSSDGGGMSELGRVSLEKIRNGAERMMNMVSGVLAYSQLAAADQPREAVSLRDTISDVEADLELMIRQKSARITQDGLPAIHGVPVLIHQLFYNLLNNALKFTEPGVVPEIRISATPPAEGMVEIHVADNGIGFEPEYADRIFTTFTRLHSKDTYEGTGLGLSLCKRIVERHGGRIRAEGRPGQGAVFILTLPVAF